MSVMRTVGHIRSRLDCFFQRPSGKGCPGTGISKKSAKSMKDAEALSKSWKDLPEKVNVKVGRCRLTVTNNHKP